MKNDHFIRVHDYLSNPDAAFFVTQTPKQAVILNNTWFYHPASIAGRRIFNGYPYFTWSYGYDNRFREELTYRIYNSGSKELACDFLLANNIDYLQFSKHSEGFIDSAQTDWLKEMKPEYVNSSNGFAVYSTRGNCIQ